jgi:hypothetical protein
MNKGEINLMLELQTKMKRKEVQKQLSRMAAKTNSLSENMVIFNEKLQEIIKLKFEQKWNEVKDKAGRNWIEIRNYKDLYMKNPKIRVLQLLVEGYLRQKILNEEVYD